MWLGFQNLFPTPSCCLAASMMQHSSLPRLCQVLRSGQAFNFFATGGGTFALRHSGKYACGIPDEDTIVMTGGLNHNYVTRWLPSSSPSSSCKNGIKSVFLYTKRLDCNKFCFMASPSMKTSSAFAIIMLRGNCLLPHHHNSAKIFLPTNRWGVNKLYSMAIIIIF